MRLLAVSPDYRGRGIGKLLTKEGILRAKKDNARGLGLYTSEIMTAEGGQPQAPPFQGGERLTSAQKMYSSLGFKRERELPPMLGLRYWLYLLSLTDERQPMTN